MADEHYQLRWVGRRVGIFGGRTILGTQFENEQRTRGWHVTTWKDDGHPIDEYWIEGGEFYEMLRLDIPGYPGMRARIETGRLIGEMDTAKKETILKGLATWENEEHE